MPNWKDGKSIREIGEELGYTQHCRGCGQLTDTGWCGCAAGETEEHRNTQAEISVLDEVCGTADELAGRAADCQEIAPITYRLIMAAAYFAEVEYREATGCGSCGHSGFKNGCGVCEFVPREAHKYTTRRIDL